MSTFILRFDEIDPDTRPYVGGKGAHLGEMSQMGFPVPPGFCVTTSAFQKFIATSDKMELFLDELDRVTAGELDEIRRLGEQIRNHLEHLPIPSAIEEAIVHAWRSQGTAKAYAVRSSATAEDLPGASFAGQQKTYLNVIGKEPLLDGIRRCWASLFTDRAISYRTKIGFDHREVLLSVVVQEMVFAEMSGIMFTRDPISGNRTVTSIDASYGLGEALVSGLVSADFYQVQSGQIIQKKISHKKLAIYSEPRGGTITKDLTPDLGRAQALPDERIIELWGLGQMIEKHYETSQDIEWAFANDKFYIVQSRPITTLYPIPEAPDDALHILVSLGHIQMMTAVMKPMAISLFSSLAPIVKAVGSRAYADLTTPFGIRLVRKRVPMILRRMDEQLGAALEEVLVRPNAKFPRTRIPFRAVLPMIFSVFKTIISNMFFADPIARRDFVNRYIEATVGKSQKEVSRVPDITPNLQHHVIPALLKVVPNWVTAELASEIIKKKLQEWLGDAKAFHALQRSVPGNVTSDLGLMIGDMADIARENSPLLEYLQTATDQTYYPGLDNIPHSEAFRGSLQQFMRQYGMRCPGEIDISKPRWHETPTSLTSAIMSHIRTMGPEEHRMRFEAAAREAEQVAEEIIDRVRHKKGWIKAKILRRLIHVYRNLAGLREHHKYMVMQHFDLYRQRILEASQRLVQSGVLSDASQVFYLTVNELQALEEGTFTENLDQLIASRKQQEELNQKMIPPRVMTSQGEVITGRTRDVNAPQGALIGTPVSTGVVQGHAKVVLKPEDAQLNPGEIMIAPFTDPGWTPLFYSAAGLVMEVGGMMTHGAVVAREYGIPSVVGIDHATEIIKDGAYIRVDGTHGYVQILKQDSSH